MRQLIDENWELYNGDDINIQAKVPGDITMDLYRSGLISHPHVGLNHKELGWITETDFIYQTTFRIDDDILKEDEIYLTFDGIDLFAEIYLNGRLLGKTENMFLQYSYNVKDIVTGSDNLLQVKMLATKTQMNKIDTEDYWGIFNTPRLFLRKAQCHFGWDWAPDMSGYGIYKDVYIEGKSADRISDIYYRAYNNGKVNFNVELNYDIRPWTDHYGKPLEVIDECKMNDTLIYKMAKRPNVSVDDFECLVYTQKVEDNKQFANFFIDEPQLWWPAGYGEQPMYSYRVELERNGEVLDVWNGTIAFREVRLEQEPISTDRTECKIVVNDVPIFAKGSNWVPMECFTGEVTNEKYVKLITQAKDGNMNMLRVWGGGIYENDIFYDTCDRLGVMVWQDMMFACADIPEDRPEFMANVQKEIDYQIRRLRSHPSIVVWTGGNEKVGALCKQKSSGDYFLDVILKGMILNLDDSRPLIKQSPFGKKELANDSFSGDTHSSSFEACIDAGTHMYRDLVSNNLSSFISECATMGPGSVDAYKKIFPQDKLWPMNEYWDDRLMDNPYAAVYRTFAYLQESFATEMYGESHSIEEFVAKGMTVHAEAMRAELEYARRNKGVTWGFMNWMYSDIWPSGTWSIVDYYCEPKQVYYQMRKSFQPLLVSFAQNHDKVTDLFISNDLNEAVSGQLEYGLKDLKGNVIWNKSVTVDVLANGVYFVPITDDFKQNNTYLYVTGELNNTYISNVYSHNMWKNYDFTSSYSYDIMVDEDDMIVTVKADEFAKGVILSLPENEKYDYSDNYFDLQAGEEKTVVIKGAAKVNKSLLNVTDFAKETRSV